MQTEPDENDPLYTPPKPVRRHGFVPLTQRLLKRSYEDRLRLGDVCGLDDKLSRQMILDVPVGLASVSSPVKQPLSVHSGEEDVEMKDADTVITPTKPQLYSLQTSSSTVAEGNNQSSSSTSTTTVSQSLFPLPSTAAHRIPSPRKPPGGLRVQPPSQLPQPPVSSVATSATKMSPPSSFPSHSGPKPHIAASEPSSSIAAPSPVKKKISLNDYLSRRGSLKAPATPAAAEKGQQPQSFPPNPTPTGSSDGCSPATLSSQPSKSGESIKQESPATPDGVMKDVQMSPTPTENSPPSSSSLARDPRFQSQT